MSSMSCEFVIEERKKVFIEQNQNNIEETYDVTVSYPNGGSSHGQLWVTIEGDQERRNKAKNYIKALTAPEQKNKVPIPKSLLKELGKNSKEHKKLEFDYDVVITYAPDDCAVITGSDVAVTLATSKLEDLKMTLQAKQAKLSSNKNSLKEFALKLGYEEEQITAVLDKLGPNVDRNTLLSKLINLSKQKTKMIEERRPLNTYNRYNGDLMSNINNITSNSISSRSLQTPENHGIVARGCVARPKHTQASYYPGNNNTMMTRDQYSQSSSYQTSQSVNDYNQVYSDPRQEEQIFQDLLTNSLYKQFPKSNLRYIVIDGSNVAMSHGNNKVFSCKGIQICVNWFIQRGHTQITVFVPQWRKESVRPESLIKDQYILNELEEQGYLTFTPARRINGRRIVCYDDRFVVRLADTTDGIIVSNDNFKDLSQENPKWKEVIERQLLMYSFVNDMFMPPDDPLGRHGPALDEFLRKGTPGQPRVCPYGRRCTFGSRCKYYHPEKEDKRLQVYQVLKDMFPSQDTLILSVMKKYPHERDPQQLASRILDSSP